MMYGEELHVINNAIGDAQLATAVVLEATGVILEKHMELPGVALYFGFRPTVTFDYDTQTDEGILTLYRYTKTIQTAVLGNAAGTGYAVGDLLAVTQAGASGGILRVKTLSAPGIVATVEIVNAGINYRAASNLATVAMNGAGDDAFTVTISDKKAIASIKLIDGAIAGKQYMVKVSQAIGDVSPTPPPPASYKAGEELAIEVTDQAAGGGYIAGDFQPIVIIQNRAENFANQDLWVEGTPGDE